jgi:uncharacterized protein YfdQ (DUF2303 family)
MEGKMELDLQKLLDTGGALAEVECENDLLYTVLPEGYKLEVKDLASRNRDRAIEDWEHENGRPWRNKGRVMVADVESFLLMLRREMIPASTIVTANMDNKEFTAIIDYAESGSVAGYGDRTIVLRLLMTTEFKRWVDNNRTKMNQVELADFLEANLEYIVEPPAADVIETVRALKVTKKASFGSTTDNATGKVSVAYSEDIKGETINKSVDLVSRFKIVIPPFHGSDTYKISCNLRFDTDQGVLLVHYAMIDGVAAVEHAFQEESKKVRGGVEKLKLPMINVR